MRALAVIGVIGGLLVARVAVADPVPVIDRPITLATHEAGAVLDLDLRSSSLSVGGITATTRGEGLRAGAGYGVTDQLTAGAEYLLSLRNFQSRSPLTVYGAYTLVSTGAFTIGASADLTIDLDTAGRTETVEAGVAVRYKLGPTVAVFTGTPLAPGPLGHQLSIVVQKPVTIVVPLGLALQPIPRVYLWATTELVRFDVSSSASTYVGTDFISVDAGMLVSASRHVDLGAFLQAPDVNTAKFVAGLTGRFYL